MVYISGAVEESHEESHGEAHNEHTVHKSEVPMTAA